MRRLVLGNLVGFSIHPQLTFILASLANGSRLIIMKKMQALCLTRCSGGRISGMIFFAVWRKQEDASRNHIRPFGWRRRRSRCR